MEIVSNNSNRFKILSAVCIGHFMNDFYVGMIPPITLLFAKVLSLSLTEQGLITVIVTLFSSLAQPLFGHYVDKKRKPTLLLYSVLWISILIPLTVIIKNYYIILIVIALGSLASALYHPLGSTIASNLMEKSRGMSLSIFMTVGGFAISFVPVVAINMSEKFGFESLVFLFIPGIISVVLMKNLGLNNKFKIEENIHNESKKIISKIENKKILGLNLITLSFVKVFLKNALLTYGIQIMILQGYSLSFAGLILSIHLFLRPIGTISGGILSDKFGEKCALIVSILGGSITLIMFVFINGNISILGFLMWGMFFGMSNSANVTMMQKVFPNGQSMATGLILGLPTAIGAIFVLLFGKIADLKGLIFASKISLTVLLIAIIIVFLLPNLKEDRIMC